MRFLFGVIIGIALTIGAALIHDNNVPPRSGPPRAAEQLDQLPIVDWDVLGEVVNDQVAVVRGWWDSLMGRNPAPQP
jgi:hypothetical protein